MREQFYKRGGDIEKRLGLLDERLDKLVAPPSPSHGEPASAGSQAAAPNCNSDLPYEQRTCAKIGGFTFDTPRDVLISEAKRCLEAAGVDPSVWKWMHCPGAKGSWVLLTFNSAQQLQQARQAVSSSNYLHDGRRIWLDAAKTRAELRPVRITHRCYVATQR